MLQNTINQSGKAAVFVRGFMTEFWKRRSAWDGTGPEPVISLRVCQDAGLAAIQELGDDISLPYISKLGRQITADGVVSKKKKGRKYYLTDTADTALFMDWLAGRPDWGVDIRGSEDNEIQQKMDIVAYMKKHKGVLIHSEAQLPKAQYSFLMKKFAEGKLKLAFVYEDQHVFIHNTNEMVGFPELGEFWDEHNYD